MKRRFVSGLIALLTFIRPVFGPPGACIYEFDCMAYARKTLNSRFLPVASVVVIIRVLSCNPLTYLIIQLKKRIQF